MDINMLDKNLTEVLGAFDFGGGEIVDVKKENTGHINCTLIVTVKKQADEQKRFLLQRLNTNVFKKPVEVMENIVGVTEYLKQQIILEKGDTERETLSVIKTKDGKNYFYDSLDGFWRCFNFVENSFCIQTVENPEHFYSSAKSFGKFLKQLENYPAETLHETIEKFHDTRSRFKDFKMAVAADKMGRAIEVKDEIEFVLAREADCDVLMKRLADGRLPLRVTHNDAKLNNILMDKKTGEALCVIDLDTIMPGTAVNDFGDSIRSGATYADEDEKDLSKVNFEISLYDIYTKGYLQAVGDTLTAEEIECLPWGAKLMTFETGMRFLGDYLNGDVYYNISYPTQNKDRCRTQLKLIADMEKHWDEMLKIGEKYAWLYCKKSLEETLD